MPAHAENNSISKISMPCIGSGLDQLDGDKIKLFIQEAFRTSRVQVVVYFLPTPENEQKAIPVDNEPTKRFEHTELTSHWNMYIVGLNKLFYLQIQTFKACFDWDGKCTTNWVAFTIRMALFVVNLSPRMSFSLTSAICSPVFGHWRNNFTQ